MSSNPSRRRFLQAGLTLPAAGLVSSNDAGLNPQSAKGQVILQVLNPRGVLHSVPLSGLTNPRVENLAGKRIALLSEKPDAVIFFDAMEELLKKRYPTATVLRFPSSAAPNIPDNTKEVASQCDTWLQGIKSSGSSVGDCDVRMEKLGKPGVTFTVDGLLPQRKRLAEVNGMPTLRILTIPAETFFACEGLPEKIKPIASSVFEATIKALTSPLTEAEKNPPPFVYDYGPMKFAGNSYNEANEKYQQYCIDNEIGDGLPLTPPTPEAVKWMLSGTSRSPSEELGLMTPRNGMATIEKVAINSVMAGAKPEYLPVIIAAVEGLVDRSFNLYHIQTGTLNSKVLIWVNGPIAKEIGMNSGQGFLGHGFRANSSIGRAVSLCMINIGWSLISAEVGMLGQPARYCNLTFAENEAESPWESFAVEHGFKSEDSTVTVDECISTNRLGPGGGMVCQPLARDMKTLADMLRGFGSTSGTVDMAAVIKSRYCEMALFPAFARELAGAGYTKQSLAQWLCDQHRIPWEKLSSDQKEQIRSAAKAGTIPGLKTEDCQPGGTIPSFDPKHVALLVAGGMAGQTIAFYGGGATNINADNPDAPRVDFMTKLIHRATLTKAGR